MLPKTLHLKKGDILLANLTICEPIEMFWLACDFEPTEAFEEFAPMFEEASNVPDTEVGYARFEEIYQQIRDMSVKLVNADSNQNCSYFVLHIDNDRVHTRFVLEDEAD